MADATDLKSVGSNTVRVRLSPRAPFFCLFFFVNYILGGAVDPRTTNLVASAVVPIT